MLFILAFLVRFSAYAQHTETEAVKKVINTLFDGMRKGDSSIVRSTFSAGMIFQTIGPVVKTDSPAAFLKAVGTPHTAVWDERITLDQVLIDDKLASVWTSYTFYLGGKFSHCGVNSFQLAKLADGWKIIYLVDTRRKDNCN